MYYVLVYVSERERRHSVLVEKAFCESLCASALRAERVLTRGLRAPPSAAVLYVH